MSFFNDNFVTICIVLAILCLFLEIILPSFFSLNIGIGFLIVGICNFFVYKETGFLLEHKYNLLIGSLSVLLSFIMLRRYYHNKKHKDINEY